METIVEYKRLLLETNEAICKELGLSEVWEATNELSSVMFDRGASFADRIARQEERERCIKAAQDYLDNNLSALYEGCEYDKWCEMLHDAMEGGDK